MTASLSVVTDPDCAQVLVSQTLGEHIAVMLFDERYRVAYCDRCGWTRWEWDGTRFRCPCKKRTTLRKQPLTEANAG